MMVLAKIYKVPKGVRIPAKRPIKDPLNYVVAHHKNTSAALYPVAVAVESAAKGVLAAHRDKHESYIELVEGDVDLHVTLKSTSGDAIYVEENVAPLRKGAGFPVDDWGAPG